MLHQGSSALGSLSSSCEASRSLPARWRFEQHHECNDHRLVAYTKCRGCRPHTETGRNRQRSPPACRRPGRRPSLRRCATRRAGPYNALHGSHGFSSPGRGRRMHGVGQQVARRPKAAERGAACCSNVNCCFPSPAKSGREGMVVSNAVRGRDCRSNASRRTSYFEHPRHARFPAPSA